MSFVTAIPTDSRAGRIVEFVGTFEGPLTLDRKEEVAKRPACWLSRERNCDPSVG